MLQSPSDTVQSSVASTGNNNSDGAVLMPEKKKARTIDATDHLIGISSSLPPTSTLATVMTDRDNGNEHHRQQRSHRDKSNADQLAVDDSKEMDEEDVEWTEVKSRRTKRGGGGYVVQEHQVQQQQPNRPHHQQQQQHTPTKQQHSAASGHSGDHQSRRPAVATAGIKSGSSSRVASTDDLDFQFDEEFESTSKDGGKKGGKHGGKVNVPKAAATNPSSQLAKSGDWFVTLLLV